MKDILEKINELKKNFAQANDKEEKYLLIIDFGRKLKPFLESDKTEKNLVKNCQSTTYLKTFFENNKINISAYSDALISKGLAALLIYIYNNESAETILKFPPNFLKEIEIQNIISPNRSSGLASMYTRLKNDSINHLMKN